MLPLVGVFAAATVVGVGATLGHRVARDVILPLAERRAGDVKTWWDALHRRDGDAAAAGSEEAEAPGNDDSAEAGSTA